MVKTIEIRNEEEYSQFLHRLPLYRSLLCRFTKFRISSAVHRERVGDIAHALNIKSRRKRTEYIHDRACDIIDAYNEEKGLF